MPKRGFSPLRAIVRSLVYGAEPVGQAGAVVLERYSHGQLDGGRLGGLPHYGMKGSPELSYTGLVQSPQTFRGAAQMGSATKASVQDYPALPGAQAPEALPTWLSDWTNLEGTLA